MGAGNFKVKQVNKGKASRWQQYATLIVGKTDVLSLLTYELITFFLAERYPQFFVPMVLHRAFKSHSFSSFMEKLARLSGLTNLFGSPVILKLTKN